jgi:hypothetical protein
MSGNHRRKRRDQRRANPGSSICAIFMMMKKLGVIEVKINIATIDAYIHRHMHGQ